MCGALIFSVALIPPAILIIDKFGVWRRRIYTRQQGIVLQQTLPRVCVPPPGEPCVAHGMVVFPGSHLFIDSDYTVLEKVAFSAVDDVRLISMLFGCRYSRSHAQNISNGPRHREFVIFTGGRALAAEILELSFTGFYKELGLLSTLQVLCGHQA